MTTVAEYFELDLPNNLKGALYGLELEIEDLRGLEFINSELWEIKTDGSLRNHGYEFVSCPLKKQDILKALDLLFNKVKTTEKSYSERTSIHVHCNMRDATMEEVKVFCMLYLLFEKFFFKFVDKERSNNIFCVPLADFTCPERLNRDLGGDSWNGQFSWEKYSALNIIPLHNLGTVEFRHMEGHDNKARIIQWVDLIDCLKTASQKNSLKDIKETVLQLNTNSEYARFAESIFGDLLSNIKWEEYKELMYEAVMKVKLWELIEQSVETKAKKKPKNNMLEDWAEVVPMIVPPPAPTLNQNRVVGIDDRLAIVADGRGRANRQTPPVRITDENITAEQQIAETDALIEANRRFVEAFNTQMSPRQQSIFIQNHRSRVYNELVGRWLSNQDI